MSDVPTGNPQDEVTPQLGGIDQQQPAQTGEEPARKEGDTAPLSLKKAQIKPQREAWLPRVNEVDVDATRVAPSAYIPPQSMQSTDQSAVKPDQQNRPQVALQGRLQGQASTRMPAQVAGTPLRKPGKTSIRPNQRGVHPAQQSPRNVSSSRMVGRHARQSDGVGKYLGCLFKLFFAGVFAIVLIALCLVSILFYQYYQIASTLPDIKDLQQRASQFETTRILDRNGDVLYEILDPHAGRRTYVPLQNISPFLVAATITTEDKAFYTHPGFNLMAIARAFLQNYQSGEMVSGASTITQQLARALLFSPQERAEQTYQRKIREAILAAEITRRYSKDKILELYLNEIYYGNLAYGVEAASETYFGTTSDKLTLGQAAFLAGLPQAPAIYDVYTDPEAVFKRLENVMVLMYQASQEQGCIVVSNSPQRVCVDPVSATKAINEIKSYKFNSPNIPMRFPHWVNYVRSLLEAQFDAQTIYRSGFTVYTTIDPNLQDLAQAEVRGQVDSMAAQHATDGALVAIRPSTGEILAMVGSADFNSETIHGQVNMAVSPRQPGSSIKPLTYLAAFEKGWTPATLIWDVPSEFPPSGRADDLSQPYIPVDYDGKYHGPVTVRTALANSYNIPAVKALQFVGVYDDPNIPEKEGLIAFAQRMGITTLTRSDYGLSLTLGGGEVSLLELTGAYATIANYGRRIQPVAIIKILDHTGDVVYTYQPPVGDMVIRAEHAYLISTILSDNQARGPAFGTNSVLKLPFSAAVKTGTTNDYRDNWTLGYTPDIAIGVWVGNADYTPMKNTSGVSGAAPIWNKMMQAAIQQLTGGNPTSFTRPPGVVEQVICEISGSLPSQWCPKQRSELFAADQPPLPKEKDLWQKVVIDTWTGLLASPACRDFTDDQFVLNVDDAWAKKWIKKNPQGQAWAEDMGFPSPVIFAPDRECRADDPRPVLSFLSPREGDTITSNPLNIYALVDATQWYESMRLEWGLGDKPVEWQVLAQGRERLSQPDLLYSWDMVDTFYDNLPEGRVTLRLTIYSTQDTYAEGTLHLDLLLPTPTMIPTPTPTWTPWPTYTPWPTPSETPTETPTLIPTETPTVTPTP